MNGERKSNVLICTKLKYGSTQWPSLLDLDRALNVVMCVVTSSLSSALILWIGLHERSLFSTIFHIFYSTTLIVIAHFLLNTS